MNSLSRNTNSILIVEDEAVSRRVLAALLRSCGYRTAAVESAEEALALLSEGEHPIAAVVDLDLPGMNGMEFIQKIQATNPEVAPVLVSATSRDRLEDAYPRMPVPFMRKPIDFRKLLTVIGRGGVH